MDQNVRNPHTGKVLAGSSVVDVKNGKTPALLTTSS